MPYKWNDIIVVTMDEIVPKFYTECNLKAILYRCKDKDYGLKRVQRGCRGRKMMISFDSLPTNVQESLKDLPVKKYDPYAV